MAEVSGLSSASCAAISGIRDASRRLDLAAVSVARAGVLGEDTVTLSDKARNASAATQATGDLARAMVDLRVARYQTQSSVAVLRTADDMTRTLEQLGARSQT
jgi:hypothetical protein